MPQGLFDGRAITLVEAECFWSGKSVHTPYEQIVKVQPSRVPILHKSIFNMRLMLRASRQGIHCATGKKWHCPVPRVVEC